MWLVALGAEQVNVGSGVTVIAGNVTKGRDGSLGVCSYHGVEVVLQGVEAGDEKVYVVDTNTHLVSAQWQGGREGCGREGRRGR